ncbi:MAG: hypothetical protein Q8N53_22785 [Longimicrobiales bacterium]|nr:hypothetical protein [Longimicrobiales bacterium]
MTTNITAAFRRAVRFAAVTIGELATEAGYSAITFDVYTNRRAPSPAVALALADALDVRAARLGEHARRLREVASREGPRGRET